MIHLATRLLIEIQFPSPTAHSILFLQFVTTKLHSDTYFFDIALKVPPPSKNASPLQSPRDIKIRKYFHCATPFTHVKQI